MTTHRRRVTVGGEVGYEYDLNFIMANPIPARCGKCGRTFEDGQRVTHFYFAEGKLQERIQICNEAIRAPALSGCRCFYCGGSLKPLEPGGPSTVEEVADLKIQPALFSQEVTT